MLSPTSTSHQKPRRAHSRVGDTRLLGGHFEPAVLRQVRLIAVEEDTTNQELLTEALNDFFAKRGKPRIAR
jgi:hypothetical protein